MRKRVLRLALGSGYVLLLTVMLLYQAGAFGERRSWSVATLTTLFLGVALAVVLALYMRVNEQIRKEGGGDWQGKKAGGVRSGQHNESRAEDKEMSAGEKGAGEPGREEKTESSGDAKKGKETDESGKEAEKKTKRRYVTDTRSYEEIYTDFLHVCEGRGLSERELEVAWLLYRGHTNRQIGEELFIAETTVKKHVTHIYQKLEVYSRKDFRAMVQNGASSNGCFNEME